MKLNVEESASFAEVEITIQCPRVDEGLQGLIERIRALDMTLQCKKDSCCCTTSRLCSLIV